MEQNEELTKKLQLVSECTMSAKENADQLERMLKAEEKEQDSLTQELQELRSLKYRKEQELITLQNELKFVEAKVKVNYICLLFQKNFLKLFQYYNDFCTQHLKVDVAILKMMAKNKYLSKGKENLKCEIVSKY